MTNEQKNTKETVYREDCDFVQALEVEQAKRHEGPKEAKLVITDQQAS